MRTLVAAAEPEPRPVIISGHTTTTTVGGYATSLADIRWAEATAASAFTVPLAFFEPCQPEDDQPREPYRTTAWVGRPIPEIES